MGDLATLPQEVQAWAGLDDDNPVIKARRNTLAGLNDNGEGFDSIAKLIEKYL